MPHNPRLVWNRKTSTDTLGRHIVTHSFELEQGGTLTVAFPQHPTAHQALEIADQLRELVDVLSVGAVLPADELAAREDLLAKAKALREQHVKAKVQGQGSEDLLGDYDRFRGAVVEYMVTIAYLCSAAREQVVEGPAM
jgi:hypothetical protein